MSEPAPEAAPVPAGVHHHVVLERRGGTARVAHMLARLQRGRRGVSLSHEMDEPGGVDASRPESFPCPPDQLASLAPPGAIMHVHATRDWPALLAGFQAAPRPLVITAHDCSLITGGCAYPAFCPKHEAGCPDPCPRAYADTKRIRAQKHALVQAVRPVLVSPSAWLAGLLRREWPGLPVKVAPNGVDIPAQGPGNTQAGKLQARARLGVPPAARTALFLAHGGTQAAYKGGDRYQPILASIASRVPGVLGIVAGGEEARMQGGMMFLPYLDDDLLGVVLSASDVLVYPSLADNHPLIVLEAMAHGLPVAAYGAGGIPEQVRDGVTGLLVSVLDEDGLVAAASALLGDPALARTMGENGLLLARKHFSAGRMAGDYDKIYARMPIPSGQEWGPG